MNVTDGLVAELQAAEQLEELAPALPWSTWLAAIGGSDEVLAEVVRQAVSKA